MKLYRSDEHFPYRRYGANPQRRHRRWRYALRRAVQSHDAWAWAFGVFVLAVFLVLEWLR